MTAKKSDKSLAAYMREKQRAACAVCQLDPEIRDQLGPAATKKGFTRSDQVEWLHEVVGATHVTLEALNSHFNARHEQQEI